MTTSRRPNDLLHERLVFSLDFGAVSADTTTKIWKTAAGRSFRIDRVYMNLPSGLAQDASNYCNFKIMNAALIAASWSTLTGQQGTVTADTPVDLVLSATDTNRVLPPSTHLSLLLDVTGTITTPTGRVVVEGRYI